MRFILPAIYGTGANPIDGLEAIVSAYEGFSVEVVPVDGTVIVLNKIQSVDNAITLNAIQTGLVNSYNQIRASLDSATLNPEDVLAGQSFDGSVWGTAAPIIIPENPEEVTGTVAVSNFPVTQAVSGTVNANTGLSQPLTDAQLRAGAVPVSGTFFQATQPVSAIALPLPTGAASETTLAAVNTKTPALGQAAMAASTPVVIASNQTAIPVSFGAASVLFKGRTCSFRTPGRAGTAGQKILSLHNAAGSPVTVTLNKVFIDLMQTVVKGVTVAPPVVRLWKVTVLPTNGTALVKNKIGGTGNSNAAVTVLGDASADGTGSASTLTATLPAGAILTEEFAPRLITAASYENADRMEFLGDTTITLGALEGVVVFLDYVLATQNPTTDMWVAGIEWSET